MQSRRAIKAWSPAQRHGTVNVCGLVIWRRKAPITNEAGVIPSMNSNRNLIPCHCSVGFSTPSQAGSTLPCLLHPCHRLCGVIFPKTSQILCNNEGACCSCSDSIVRYSASCRICGVRVGYTEFYKSQSLSTIHGCELIISSSSHLRSPSTQSSRASFSSPRWDHGLHHAWTNSLRRRGFLCSCSLCPRSQPWGA